MSEEVKVRRGSLDDLTPDDRNMNKHTSYGMSLIEKSIRKHKFGRSILVDKNDRTTFKNELNKQPTTGKLPT